MEPGDTILEPALEPGPAPNMTDYDAERARFSWAQARAALDGLPAGGLNIAHEAVDRHAAGPRAGQVALRCLQRDGSRRDVTFAELAASSSRFANVLDALEVAAGERVFALLPPGADLTTVALGTLKHRSVLSPLFRAYGPEPIRLRLQLGAAAVLVTTDALYRRKVAAIRHRLPALRHVLLTDRPADDPGDDGTVALAPLLAAAGDDYRIAPTDPDDWALLHFTSGTTGTPKGVVHVHGAVVAHHATGRLALDLHPDDVFWCTADPGWVTGTSYGIVAPLVHGVTSIVDDGDFDAERWYQVLHDEQVTVWYTAPTALRMLMRAGPAAAAGHDLRRLRLVASVGEALDPEAVLWGRRVLGRPVHDTWWQTETGGIMIANYRCLPIRPGSMGKPLPGVEAAVLERDDEGRVVLDDQQAAVAVAAGQVGELALRPGWPSMFRGYLDDPERTRASFAGGWYLTGDLARRDRDGYFWFVGRGDDVIKSAGHLIGPFEVEAVLLQHPAVAEAAAVGVADPVAGQIVVGVVSLHAGRVPSEQLRLELIGFGRRHLGPAVAPRHIVFDQQLPHTDSGKILRRVLKDRFEQAQAGSDGGAGSDGAAGSGGAGASDAGHRA